MEVKFSKPFEKDLRALRDKSVVLEVDEIINHLRQAGSISQVQGIKKLKGHQGCYRIRLGSYRLGILIVGKTIWLARLMHRKEIYRYFP